MKKILFIVTILTFAGVAPAQDISSILGSVEKNNKELQTLAKANEAQRLETSTLNNLEDPSVEYSPFFSKTMNGVASSELVVKQGFDFPTLYAARNKYGKTLNEVASLRYQTARRDVLLEAEQLCLDVVLLNQERKIIERRCKNANDMLAAYEKRLEEGDANILELNKVKMERMNMQTEAVENETARRAAAERLRALNGNKPMAVETLNDYPSDLLTGDYDRLYERALKAELMLRTAEADVKSAAQNVKLNKQNAIPRLELGYRRNTEGTNASNGFLVGASFPLFSGRNKLKSARVRLEESEFQLDNTRLQTESRLRSLIDQLKQTRMAADVYDTSLLYASLDLLRKAVDGGQISVVDYYVEENAIFRNLQTHLQLVNKAYKIIADITRNEL